MRNLFRNTLYTVAAALLALGAVLAATAPAAAATPNYAVAVADMEVITLHLSGQYTASTTAVARFAMPFPCRIVGVAASARASGGTSPTLTVDLKDDGTSVLSSAISVTAGSIAEGTVANPTVGDESAMTLDFTIGGTTPTWNDITVLVTVVRT